jgi:hypothetical protein
MAETTKCNNENPCPRKTMDGFCDLDYIERYGPCGLGYAGTKITEKKTIYMGMLVSVLRNAELGESSNGGISSSHDRLLLVGEGVPEIFKSDGKLPVVKLIRRKIYGSEYLHVEPVEPVHKGNVGWMAGGNFVHSSDSRFPNRYPISIHDRQETQSVNDLLSQ